MIRRQPPRPARRRSNLRHLAALLGAVVVLATAAAACDEATASTNPTSYNGPTWRILTLPPSVTPYVEKSGASPSATDDPASVLNLPHADPLLESSLPEESAGYPLQRFSMSLDKYIGSSTGGDRRLFTPWLVAFGLTPEQVSMAAAADLTERVKFSILAIKVPGADAKRLQNGFADAAKKANWQVDTTTIVDKTVAELVDPELDAASGHNVAYAYAANETLFVVVTPMPDLLLEALAKLP